MPGRRLAQGLGNLLIDAVGELISLINGYNYVGGDPVKDAVGELIFHNRYNYVNGNPVNFVDPNGMQAVPNSQGFCPHGYVNVSGDCAPIIIREPICSVNNLLQARAATDPTRSPGDTSLDLWLTHIKAR